MTREEAIEKLHNLAVCSDTEMGHYEADHILCELLIALGYEDVVNEYLEIYKWYA